MIIRADPAARIHESFQLSVENDALAFWNFDFPFNMAELNPARHDDAILAGGNPRSEFARFRMILVFASMRAIGRSEMRRGCAINPNELRFAWNVPAGIVGDFKRDRRR